MFGYADMQKRQPAPLFVDLGEENVLTYKVGPKGKTNPTTIGTLIKLVASRG